MKRSCAAAALIAAITLASPRIASAGLIVGINPNSQTEFSVRSVGEGTASPIFGPRGELLGPGRGFPTISAIPYNPMLSGPVQTVSGPIAPLPLVATSSAALIDSGRFGSSSVTIAARGSSSVIGNSASGAGVFWNPGFVSDVGVEFAFASIVISQASATFTNTGPLPVTARPGAVLSVRATLGSEFGSFGAAALTGSFTDSLGNTTAFEPIIVAGDGAGGLSSPNDFASGGASASFTPGIDGLSFTAYGLSRLSSTTTIPVGGMVTLQGTLTLIGDPATVAIFDAPPNLLGIDFGLFAANPADVTVVPEPSTWVSLSSALMVIGLARCRLLPGRAARR
jgi:hypothetical protein